MELDVPAPDARHAIQIFADEAMRWQDGPDQVWMLRGHCRLKQGDVEARCRDAVVWTRPALLGTQTHYVTCYLESDVSVTMIESKAAVTGFSGGQWARFQPSATRTLADTTASRFSDYKGYRSSHGEACPLGGAEQYRSRQAAQVRPCAI